MRILYVLLTMSILINLTWFYKLKVRLWRERVKHWRLHRKDDWAMRVARKMRLLDAVDVPNKQAGEDAAYFQERPIARPATKAGAMSASELLNNQGQELLDNKKTIEELNKYKFAFDLANGLNERTEFDPGVFRYVISELVKDPVAFLNNHPNLMKGANADFVRTALGVQGVQMYVGKKEVEAETEVAADAVKEQRKDLDKKISKAAMLVNKKTDVRPFIPEEKTDES